MDELIPPVKVGETHKLKIECRGDEGDGIAKVDNFTIFVEGTKPGQVVNVKITRVLRSYAFAEII